MATIVNVASAQSTLEGVIPGPASLLPTEFSVRRAYEGPQVIIEWNEPTEVPSIVSLRLVRRLFGFPTGPDDGDIIFDSAAAATIISDLDVEACRCYYYKLFSFGTLGDIIISKFTQGFVIPMDTGFFAEKTFELLTESFKVSDKGQNQAEEIRLALLEGPDPGSPEVFNIGEDGSVLKGPLRRFLKILGPQLDEPKGLMDCLLDQLDVDESCEPNLAHLATLLGLALNTELTPEKIRNEVRQQVEFLKLKGTIPGIQARFRSVSGLTPVIREQCDDVFFLNDLTCTTLGFTVDELANFLGSDDVVCRIAGFPDTTPFWLWFTVFVNLTPGFELDQQTARKWCLAIEEASPACHRGFLTLADTLADTIPISFVDIQEDQDDLSELMPVSFVEAPDDVQVAFPALWLILSDETKTIGAPNYTAVFAVATLP